MRARITLALVLTGMMASTTGCKKQLDTAQFKSAINQSYTGKHECIWPEPIKLPVEIDPSKDDRIRIFDALADAGLLDRGTAEKQRFLFGTKGVNKYDLSDKGHPSWTPDVDHPGYGNFCFGRFNVTTITSAIPNDPSNPTQYTIHYQYEVEGIPEWARTPESMHAFPKIAADTSIQSATATVVKDSNGGWVVPPAPVAP